MSNLTGVTIENSYGGLINIGPSGADATFRNLTDGFGNTLPIQVSTSGICFTGTTCGAGIEIIDNVNNAVITAGGTGNPVVGETLLTFNGSASSPALSVNGIQIGRGGGNCAFNLAIGGAALCSNTTGISNLAIGAAALCSNTTGTGNVAIGRCALTANQGGSSNIGIGDFALSKKTTGDSNIGIGRLTLCNLENGGGNVAMGLSSMCALCLGSCNVAIGPFALRSTCSAVNNVAIGFGAGQNNNGNNNTFIGCGAGRNVTTGTSNVLIGNWDGGAIATQNQNIAISDGAGNVVYFVEGLNLNTGIGLNHFTPTRTLDVKGDVRIRAALYDSNNQPGSTGQVLVSLGATGTQWKTKDYYLSAVDTSTQLNAGATAANLMKFNTVEFASGISIADNSTDIVFSDSGKYNIQFSAQLKKTTGGEDNADIWLLKNFSNVVNSNTRVTVTGNPGYAIAAWNFLVDVNAGDKFQLAWHSADITMELHADVAANDPARPAIPSVILSVVPA